MSFISLVEAFGAEPLSDDLAELGEILERLSPDDRARAASIYSRILESNRKRRKLLTLVRDSIEGMRLDIKYLEFDLEATRRERDRVNERREPEDEIDEIFDQELDDEVDDP